MIKYIVTPLTVQQTQPLLFYLSIFQLYMCTTPILDFYEFLIPTGEVGLSALACLGSHHYLFALEAM